MKRKQKTNILKKAVALTLAFAMTAGMATIVPATDTPVASKVGDFATANTNTGARSNFGYGECTITNIGNYYMEVYSYTMANAIIDRVTTLSVLERLYNGSWEIYAVKQDSSYGTDLSDVTLTEKVPGGYYYRGRGIHITCHNNDETRKEVTTGSLWLAQ